MGEHNLNAISPIDGRYASKTSELNDFFSEKALMKYRLIVEIEYFISLCESGIPELKDFDATKFSYSRLTQDNKIFDFNNQSEFH